mgnify:CR=1 FL=1
MKNILEIYKRLYIHDPAIVNGVQPECQQSSRESMGFVRLLFIDYVAELATKLTFRALFL